MDINILTLISKADIMIKLVLIVLLVFSVISWAIFLSRYFMIKKAEQESETFYSKFKSANDLDVAYTDSKRYELGFLPSLYSAGYEELKSLCNIKLGNTPESLENIQRAMMARRDILINVFSSKITSLAAVGSSSPFIGLLGTVWGIINAFRGLAVNHNNTLSAVAPGIAEALITTAVGLLTAIPAVIFYNHISRKIEKIEQRSNSFIYEFINISYKVFMQPESTGKGDKKSNGSKKSIQENVQ
jgi:biopolymer transport protein TolQ